MNFIIRVRFGSPNNKNQLRCLLFGEGRFSIRERGLFEIHSRNHSGTYILFFIHPIKQKIQHVGCLNQPAAPWKPRPRPPNLPNPPRPRHGVQHHVRVDGRASWVSPKLASFQIFLGTFFFWRGTIQIPWYYCTVYTIKTGLKLVQDTLTVKGVSAALALLSEIRSHL